MRIVFCHNVYVRYRTLYETLKIEKELFPDSYSIVAFNDAPPPPNMEEFSNVEYIPFHGKTHKIGCTNGCMTAIKGALTYNPDVIVFSHDDVMLNRSNIKVFNENLNAVYNKKHDVICRRPGNGYGCDYYLMECFIISGDAARKSFLDKRLYDDECKIAKDIRGSISPEVFLYNTLNDADLDILALEYEHKLEGYNETLENLMGFTHINAGERGWHD